ncbi:bifunctional diguanylate cyclase/phosphodiesterase [Actinoplanes sp. N902-109]|uniref:putative bifunctional diguanylate cyclase/phosphodiesterase n=1 Tax=Actinoplanes sp. (strain N902-109) TaxID=649831 RepID=UPI0003295132|nr:bifunctional diguanylate cyclase/phosphodiesterase [Actinoplanes sp. N902-109]AGL20508.1 diguanylate cyclase/phosphodiesterase [Actinoplanes sp. N902-109]
MGAALSRCSMPGNWRARRARRGGSVQTPRWALRSAARSGAGGRAAIGAAVLVDAALWLTFPRTVAHLPAEFWVLAGLALVVDARPYVLANRRASSIILPSICFTFGIVLAWGFVPALAVQLASIAVAGVRLRHSGRRALNLAGQHTVALAAAALVGYAAGLSADAAPTWDDALLTMVAAAAWIAARQAVSRRGRPRRRVQRWRLELFATAALLLLGPVVLTAAQAGLTVVPLVLLALHAVHRMVRSAGETERASRTDALTGLPNRRALQATVAERGGTLLLLDLDRFRTVNDALGHALGDRLLVEVGQRLAASVPAHDLVVRLGGDEFAVLATRVDGPVAARRIATHLADALAAPFALNGLPVDVSASIGIALPPGDGASLLRRAEAAMYEAKQRGSQIAVHPGEAEPPTTDLALLADLRTAVQQPGSGIVVFYQPQIDVATGEVVGVEALLRWRHPTRGMVGPEELLRVAEQTPVMRRLTSRVLHEVVAQTAMWRRAGRPLRASVNVSVRDLHAPGIVTEIQDLLQRYDVPATLLQLEITESALMADPHRVLDTITRLDRAGVAISLDDFGTGYSSLQHLRRLPLSEVKIDRSFVLGMATDRGDAAIVRSMVELGGSLGLRVVAEGVEDERTWRLLAGHGCHAAQGWFHARPMPALDFDEWLARHRPLPAFK